MAIKEARALPTQEQVAVASYKLSSALSDVDSFVTAVESQTNNVPLAEALAMIESGEPFPVPPLLDLNTLARIVVFATDALEDAERLTKEAQTLLDATRALYHENDDDRQPEGFARYQRAVRAWHEQEAAKGEEA